jgi:TonB family protein
MDAAVVPPPPASPPPSAITAPASIGKPHSCDENLYPVAALQVGAQGTSDLTFKITPQGSVTDVSVLISSGNVDLDNAAVVCARDWQYRPAVQNGVPVEVPWRARVVWRFEGAGPLMAIANSTFSCIMSDKTSRDEIRQATLRTVVRIHFSNGTVGSVAIVASSGFPDLDRRVADCYAQVPPELTAAIPGEQDKLFVGIVPRGN